MMQAAARRVAAVVAAALLLVFCATVAGAQSPEQFYKGRQLSMIVFSGAGSTYDIYARLLTRHLGNHIPGKPTFIVQNMQGAGGLKAVEYLFKIAPKTARSWERSGAAWHSSRCSARTRSDSIRSSSPGSAA
jgi:tripartite-type tricarboxylate transporter receptor subunit TctC